MALTIGNKYVVNIGNLRGTHKYDGYFPTDMLPDGTVVTIVSKQVWYKVAECPNKYAYPKECLIPYNPSPTKRLIKAMYAYHNGSQKYFR